MSFTDLGPDSRALDPLSIQRTDPHYTPLRMRKRYLSPLPRIPLSTMDPRGVVEGVEGVPHPAPVPQVAAQVLHDLNVVVVYQSIKMFLLITKAPLSTQWFDWGIETRFRLR